MSHKRKGKPANRRNRRKGKPAKQPTDLQAAQREARELQTEAQNRASNFQAYFERISGEIRQILEDAGVWDQVHELEIKREDLRKQVEARAQEIRKRLTELNVIIGFLQTRAEAAAKREVKAKAAARAAAKTRSLKKLDRLLVVDDDDPDDDPDDDDDDPDDDNDDTDNDNDDDDDDDDDDNDDDDEPDDD